MGRFIQLFPIWAILFSAIAYFNSNLFIGLKSFIVPLLMLIMLTMGLTLKIEDFQRVIKNKTVIALGLVLQFSIMPLVAFILSLLISLEPNIMMGMILVGSVAGGTASNVLCYLAKGDVALSVTMTAVSTIAGVVLTPLLTNLLIGQVIDIQVFTMLTSLVKVVLLPLLFGVFLNYFFSKQVCYLKNALPIIAMLAIIFVISIVVGLNQNTLKNIPYLLLLVVILHNLLGLLMGYYISKKIGFDEQVCRAMAFEVGMQNSGLAVALAIKFFTPAAAIAGTIFSIWHNISGSILASYWQKKAPN